MSKQSVSLRVRQPFLASLSDGQNVGRSVPVSDYLWQLVTFVSELTGSVEAVSLGQWMCGVTYGDD